MLILEKKLFEPLDERTAKEIGHLIADNINSWDNDVVIEKVRIKVDVDNSRYDIEVLYNARSVNINTNSLRICFGATIMADITTTLVPNYLDMDFATAKTTLQELLKKNPIYSQYRVDAEGNNITIMIELIAYLIQLCTYYMNMIAKNGYISTTELYETAHMLSQLAGYNPQGYRSSKAELTLTIDTSAAQLNVGDQLLIPAWKKVTCDGLVNPVTTDSIQFVNMKDITTTVATTASSLTVSLSAREGLTTVLEYHGSNIESDYRLYLPMEPYDYDDDLEDPISPINVFVNGILWTRLSDFYEQSSGLEIDNSVYMFKIDKYKRYYIEFSENRTVPKSQDEILVALLKSSGLYGNVPSGSINLPEPQFVYNITNSAWLDNSFVEITNSAATVGGSDIESIDEIKQSTIGVYHSQFRNINRDDYISHLESRSDIIKAMVWGEQDISPSGDTSKYNKINISLIPDVWSTNTISTSSGSPSGVLVPINYSDTWKTTVSTYLEPRKIISTYEEYVLPDLVYFSFIVGLKVRSNYTFAAVEADVIDKLTYYFQSSQRKFYDIISHTDIISYMMDFTKESPTSTFDNVKGLETFIVRDIICDNNTVKEYALTYNETTDFPHFMTASAGTYDNQLRRIQLSFDQFPMLNQITCVQEY